MASRQQKPPIRIPALSSENSNPATIFFLHGYDDDAEGFVNIAQQFQAANKLPHLKWVFPNAPWNHEAMANAWYPPTSFSPIPVGRSSTENEEDEDEFNEEGEDEILSSVEYLCTLIDEEIKSGVKTERIVIGGFSQGCAISLVTSLASRYQGKIGGVVALSGYLPRGKKIFEGRKKFMKDESKMKVLLAHGTKDMLVPMRVFRDTKARVERTIGEEALESKEYEGMGHVTSGAEFRDICTFLEKILPE
ncbi:uncharacterized protein PAC_08356 [Phialocephala subalpina]|uniref:Acyl-protein thioesterase 1 n=1 Tax=Phialocephala subalpina TaxID=576137 RepID=A0A1L7X0B6_9HELO|nr:uncharacterized protein PAC_08356 [Phialocephala subalpina]